jgi:hypothetical protein
VNNATAEADSSAGLSDAELLRRLPEVTHIESEEIRAQTLAVLRHTPDYFWTVPASTSGKYHNEFAREEHGLWIHTKMAAHVCEEMLPSWIGQGYITDDQADLVRQGVLLHDLFKQDLPENRDPENPADCHTADDHDLIAAEWLAEHTDVSDVVVHAVAAHNGPDGWGDGPSPTDTDAPVAAEVAREVHTCDMMASRATITAAVYDPCEELTEKYPELPTP